MSAEATESMSEIAFNTKIETPEGPFTAKTVLKTPTAVMTRTDEGAVRFAMSKLEGVSERQQVLAIGLDNGRSLRVGAQQILLAAGMREVRAGDLKPGDALEYAFAFPAGYTYKTDDGEERRSDGMVRVTSVEPAGEADVYSLSVERTGRFVFSAGALGVA